MNILMMTNNYPPHVGGVARSVELFTHEFRRRGHRVMVIAPRFEGAPEHEEDVLRVPAIQNFNSSDFSVRIPIPGLMTGAIDRFVPDIVHAHQPILLGDAALRVAASRNIPLVFTHHTMYEQYTHYVPGDSPTMRELAIRLPTAYANLCDAVIAPSESIAAILRERGVDSPIHAIPTGIQIERFASGDGAALRRRRGIPAEAFVVGHVGRLAAEKNLPFLGMAVVRFLQRRRSAHCLVVGGGPFKEPLEELFRRHRVAGRTHLTGPLQGQDLADAYHAMDLFAFASKSETQGLVLTEAMAAGVPVVALDAPGVREVVEDRRNGRLLPHEHLREMVAALEWVASLEPPRRRALAEAARATAEQFALPRSADRVLEVYESVRAKGFAERRAEEDDAWATMLRIIEAEWNLWKLRAQAAAKAVGARRRRRWLPRPKLDHLEQGALRLRRAVSRNELMIRILGLPRSEAGPAARGLIMVQIDGLSRAQLERALQRGRMPFLRRLLRRQGYTLGTFYSGLPSTTPAVQGELFYGVKMAVPAFSFRDGSNGQVVRMFQREPSIRRQQTLARQGQGLLTDGSSYANVYSGGARHAQLCATCLGFWDLFSQINPLVVFMAALAYFPAVLRAVFGGMLEVLLAVADFFRGVTTGRELLPELLFVLRRVGVSSLLRDLITIAACVDATRGVPVIHVNHLGYDEQAHLRGPSSLFAHWSLKGIDRSIKHIYRAAHRSARRHYDLWIYSDHGQEDTQSYQQMTGRPIEDAINDVLARYGLPPLGAGAVVSQAPSGRTGFWGGAAAPHPAPEYHDVLASRPPETQQASVLAAMGPIGFLYLPQNRRPDADQLAELARGLVRDARIPMVLVPVNEAADDSADGSGRDTTRRQARAWTAQGEFLLPADGARVLGEGHPFQEVASRELVELAHHAEAGDLLICGWQHDAKPVSFMDENGAHGGPGPEETRGFFCLPRYVALPLEKGYIRPIDLRRAALETLWGVPRFARGKRPARHAAPPASASPAAPQPASTTAAGPRAPAGRDGQGEPPAPAPLRLRVMTYNVHSCVGMDGKLSPGRIAMVIAQYRPDVVALQELDVQRARSNIVDQAHAIAAALEMRHHFHPALEIEEERYGDAILAHYHMELIRAEALPARPGERAGLREPRGALWVQIQLGEQRVNLINTHLGLRARERDAQVEALLGPRWLGDPRCVGPTILLGDFNALPRSRAYRALCARLIDVQVAAAGHRPRNTLWGRYPLGRIDYVFVEPSIRVVGVEVPRTDLVCVASDHLPVVVELELAGAAVPPRPAAQPAGSSASA